MKKTFVKSAWMMAAVMGAFTFSSCNNNEPNPMPDPTDLGEEVEVSIGVRLASHPGRPTLKTASTADDLNLGTTLQTINNIVIVPYVGNNAATNIMFGDFNPNSIGDDGKAKVIETIVPKETNMFRVYGNLPKDTTLASKQGVSVPDLDNSSMGEFPDYATLTDVYPAHPLYYYVEAVGVDGDATGFKVGTSTTPRDVYDSATNNPTEGKVGENNRILITNNLRYGVGALAAAVLDGVAEGDSIFFLGTEAEGEITPVAGSYIAWEDFGANKTDSITVEGIIIEKQAIGFDADFTPKTQTVSVYAQAADGNKKMVSNKLSYGEESVINNTGNIYSVVAPTKENGIVVNFQFKNNSNRYFALSDTVAVESAYKTADVVAPGDYFYLATTLKRDVATNTNNNDIFQAYTSTLLNATVKDWGKASQTPVETADVELGITVDVTWDEGIVYDVEL